jgi:hypothetical protein
MQVQMLQMPTGKRETKLAAGEKNRRRMEKLRGEECRKRRCFAAEMLTDAA